MTQHTPRRAHHREKAPARQIASRDSSSASETADSGSSPAAPFIEPDLPEAMISDAAPNPAQREVYPEHELDAPPATEREIDPPLDSVHADTESIE